MPPNRTTEWPAKARGGSVAISNATLAIAEKIYMDQCHRLRREPLISSMIYRNGRRLQSME
jgi:hypothetical protein